MYVNTVSWYNHVPSQSVAVWMYKGKLHTFISSTEDWTANIFDKTHICPYVDSFYMCDATFLWIIALIYVSVITRLYRVYVY